MKAFIRSLCMGFVVVGMLGLTGCGPDNTTEGEQLSKKMGDPGPANPNAPVIEAKPVTSQVDHFNQTRAGMDAQKNKGGTPAPKK